MTSRVSDSSFVDSNQISFDWTAPDQGATSFTSQENSWFIFDPILTNAADPGSAAFPDQTKIAFGLDEDTSLGQHNSESFAHLVEESITSKLEDKTTTPDLYDTRSLNSRPTLRDKRRPRRTPGSSHVSGDRGFSPNWSRRTTSMSNKSFSNSLSRFTLPDENGKRRIRNEVMSIAETLPALPGLYFDKKQKGFRVRYQNVYVGWVALSRFPSIEEAYISAREIWESAKSHAEKFQTPHAAVMASYPLQKEAQASGKNRGGRPRTVTQLPPDPSNWLTAGAFMAPATSVPPQWPRSSDVSLYGHDGAAALCELRNTLGDTGATDVPGIESFWSPAGAFPSNGSLLTPGSKSASETPLHANYNYCQPSGYLNDSRGLLEPRDESNQLPTFSSYSRTLCTPENGMEAFGELDQQPEFCRPFSSELPGAISYSQPVPEDLAGGRKRRRDENDLLEPQSKRSDWTRPDSAAAPSDASTAIPPQSPNS